jgi:hypothetical protein
VLQQHLLTFEQEWTDKSDGRTLPNFVTDELHDFLCCGATPDAKDKPSLPLSHYISWGQLLRRTFEIDTVCPRCKTPLRLIGMIETEDTIKKILSVMGLPTEAPKLWSARPPPWQSGGEAGDWLN